MINNHNKSQEVVFQYVCYACARIFQYACIQHPGVCDSGSVLPSRWFPSQPDTLRIPDGSGGYRTRQRRYRALPDTPIAASIADMEQMGRFTIEVRRDFMSASSHRALKWNDQTYYTIDLQAASGLPP